MGLRKHLKLYMKTLLRNMFVGQLGTLAQSSFLYQTGNKLNMNHKQKATKQNAYRKKKTYTAYNNTVEDTTQNNTKKQM